MKLSTGIPRLAALLFLIALLSLIQPEMSPGGDGWIAAEAAPGSVRAAYVPGRVVVMPRGDLAQALASLPADLPAEIEEWVPGLGVAQLAVPEGREEEAAALLAESPLVEWAEPDHLRSAMAVPNDPLYRQHQWNLRKIGMEQAWDITTGSPEVTVAVLDTGVDLSHPDLAPRLLPGYDFLNDDPDPSDDGGHGTHNAGVIAAASDNGIGVTGMAWQVRILPVKVLNSSGVGPDSAFAKGIAYAVDHGARVINMSFGSPGSSRMLSLAVRYAHNRGVLLVAAAGNTAKLNNAVIYPAAYEQVLAVGATDEEDRAADFSQHHPYVGVSAPGVGIVSTFWEQGSRGSYAAASGTSSAAPHVSGLAALLFSVDPGLTSTRARQIIQETAVDLGGRGKDDYYGTGRIDAVKALQAVKPTATPAATATPGPAVGAPPAVAQPGPPRTRWYFAEGSTASPFDLWLLLQNPNYAPAQVRVTYMRPGGALVHQDLLLPPASRRSIYVNEVVPDTDVSMLVESDSFVLAERAMYFGRDGHDSAGAPEPSRNWYLAEGSTRDGFDSWILLQNPQNTPATVVLSFLTAEGRRKDLTQVLLPNSRRSIYVNLILPDAEMGTVITSDEPIIAERAMYFARGGGHGGFGARSLSREWYLAEGETGDGFETWILAMNPNGAPANLKVTYRLEDGSTEEGYHVVPPMARLSIPVDGSRVAGRFGARVESDQAIVVERSSYFASGRGGHSVMGSPEPALDWYLPEGSTKAPFRETIAVLNPGEEKAILALTFMKADGRTEVQYAEMEAHSRLTLDVDRLAPDSELSARVSSDRPVVVERSMYFAEGEGGHSTAGVPR